MIINLNTKTRKDSIRLYIDVLNKFHHLSDKESEVIVELVNTFLEYKDKYNSHEAAVKLYLESDSRVVICETLGIKQQVFRNYLTTLKKKEALKADLSISPVLVPAIKDLVASLTINIKHV